MPISLIHSLHRPLVAILRAPRWDRYPAVAEVLWDCGINAIEVTMTTDGAVEAISRIRETLPSGALVGAGTVRTVSQAERAIDAGAQFLVSQIADPVLTQAAAALDVPFIPGALTPTEIVQAAKLGVELIKVSPVGPVGGVDYITELVGPMPELQLFPTGGVLPEDVTDYLDAGAAVVGLSRHLLGDALQPEGDLAALRERTQEVVAAVDARRTSRRTA